MEITNPNKTKINLVKQECTIELKEHVYISSAVSEDNSTPRHKHVRHQLGKVKVEKTTPLGNV